MSKQRYRSKLEAQRQREIEIIKQADYFISHQATIRATAQAFHVSKSSVHTNLTEVLPKLSLNRYLLVKKIMDINTAERHIRGGIATRKRYSAIKKH